jgi:hypothetical protein
MVLKAFDTVPDFPARACSSCTREFERSQKARRKSAASSSKQVQNGKDFRRLLAFAFHEDLFYDLLGTPIASTHSVETGTKSLAKRKWGAS